MYKYFRRVFMDLRHFHKGLGKAFAIIALPVLLFGLTQPAFAQSYSFSSVAVQGNQQVDSSTVLSYAGVIAGRTYSAAALNSAYQRVLGSGLFEEVDFSPSGNRLIIRVKEYPTIRVISIEGNLRIKDEDALEMIASRPGRVYNPQQATRDAEVLTDAYETQGRYAATVIPKIIERSENRVDLVFEVTEGRVVDVERISFVGNRAFSDSRLRRVLETKQAGALRSLIRSDTFVQDRIEFDKVVLTDFYRSRGYVDFQILSVSPEFSRDRNAFFITFNVQEGQPFTIGNISVTSNLPDVNAKEFESELRVKSGKSYSPEAIDRTIERMEKLAIEKGLNFIRVDPRVSRNERDLTLDLEFALVRGPRIFVERIDITGNTTTLDRVIRRQFGLAEGDPFNPREIRESAQRIRALGIFFDAAVESRQGTTSDQVILGVDVQEAPTGSLTFGAAFNFTTGIGFTFNFRERNFLGRGQTLNFDTTIGLDNASGGLNFYEPAFLDRDLGFRLDAQYRQTEYEYTDYDTQSFLLRPGFEFPVSENGRLALRYTLARDRIFNVSTDSSQVLKDEEALGPIWSSALGYSLSYDTRNTGFNPDAGVILRFGQDFGGLGGDSQFMNSTAMVGAETRILNGNLTLRATLEGGALMTFGNDSILPDRFFLNSSKIRGFAPAGVGPRDLTALNQDALGGNYFAVARFETDFPLGLPEELGITGGLFYDIGSVWGLDNDAGGTVDDDLHWRSTAGFSILWATPIGPLRFNFSRPLQKMPYDQAQNFDLTISTQF